MKRYILTIFMVIFAVLISIHNYFAHISKGMFIPELWISAIGLVVLAVLLTKHRIKN